MNNQIDYLYVHKDLSDLTSAKQVILSNIAYRVAVHGFCTDRVCRKEGQKSLADLAGVTDRQASNIIGELIEDGYINAKRTYFKVGNISRLGFYRFTLTDKVQRLYVNKDGRRKTFGDDFIKVSVKAIKLLGVNMAVAVAKAFRLFLLNSEKGIKNLRFKSQNSAASILGIPLTTLRRYLAADMATIIRWDAVNNVLSIVGGNNTLKSYTGADVAAAYVMKRTNAVLDKLNEMMEDGSNVPEEAIEAWVDSIITSFKREGLPTGDIEGLYELYLDGGFA